MNYAGINTSDAKTTALKQPKESVEADSALLEAEADFEVAKIKSVQSLYTATQKTNIATQKTNLTKQNVLRNSIIIGACAVIAILVVGVINFLIPDQNRWLEPERLNEIRGIFTGVVATVATSAGIGKTLNKD